MKVDFFNFIGRNKWILLIIAVGTAFRVFRLDFQSLWLDEIYTMNISNPKLSLLQMHKQILAREGFPHFYFLTLRGLYFLFGYTPVVARALSVAAGIGSIYAIYLIGKELLHKNVGLFAALLVSVNFYSIQSSQDARPYSLYFFFVIVSFWRLTLFLKNQSWRNAVWYGITSGLVLNVSFFGMFNVLTQSFIILFFLFILPAAQRAAFFKKAAVSGIIILVLLAPNYLMILKLIRFPSFWVPSPKADTFSNIFNLLTGDSEVVRFIITPLIVYYFLTVFNNSNHKINYKDIVDNKLVFSFLILFGWFFAFFVIIYTKSFGKISYALARYFISITPVIFIVLGISLYSIKNNLIRALVLISLVSFMTINLVSVKKYFTKVSKPQFREASQFVISNHKPGEKIYTSQKYWFDYYFTNDKSNIQVTNIEFEKLISEMGKDSAKVKAFWFVDAFKKGYKPSLQAQRFIDDNLYVDKQFTGYRAWAKHFIRLKDKPTSQRIKKRVKKTF
ncbi:MAG: hypothetical protein CFE23_04345 [Flavobacterium sp. BFFFF1]|uniref:glycosyltransferase family 39 protein n=1 Tax=Flavobacterium sp. BFFFF1 TaxID=2015557 RepID=UPI000BDAAB91|nr:glycosyltransferase family 39 protein [Flavobacterium sp. BFFFF1]OYU81331.1 MAG: hypothetical protein CFE23_04345 [Flavobacterium sp. BFFFF1]